MGYKEKPLLDAVDKLGPLPGWLFSNGVLAGFFAMIMVPVFGAVFTIFWGMLGTAEPAVLFEVALFGAALAIIVGLMIFAGIFISAFLIADERAGRLQFVLGGVLALLLMSAMSAVFLDDVRAWMAEQPPIAGTSVSDGG
ncbi:MAG: hypothetical protein AAGD92_00865 [Pseudomonadota bacterium]